MNIILLPFIAVVANAVYLTISKAFFKRYTRLTSREFNWLQFAGILFVLFLLVPFFGEWPISLSSTAIWSLFGVGALAILGNILYFWGIDHEKISDIEPFLLFTPLITILIASFFYSDERSWVIYLAAFLASVVLGWSHIKKHHLSFTWGIITILAFSVMYGFEAVLVKSLLYELSPIMLYLLRCLIVIVGLSLFSRPDLSIVKKHHLAPFGILGGLAVAAMITTYTAFHLLGLSQTIFIFILSPVLIYILSVIFLDDHWKTKNIIASIIITILVILVNLVK
ncbi:hypothetical protein DRH29_01220 [candidate division Kazan bacterium]|uniref:EamA domain-containing protein n=1 Tax=candidate division Kazan bacterium TaxID=2202143 RepID=A0A420ZDK8_UNCK3|nr:MAG: hypothetical protein DRH29_01220 [candidate division Kazan bacterium]